MHHVVLDGHVVASLRSDDAVVTCVVAQTLQGQSKHNNNTRTVVIINKTEQNGDKGGTRNKNDQTVHSRGEQTRDKNGPRNIIARVGCIEAKHQCNEWTRRYFHFKRSNFNSSYYKNSSPPNMIASGDVFNGLAYISTGQIVHFKPLKISLFHSIDTFPLQVTA